MRGIEVGVVASELTGEKIAFLNIRKNKSISGKDVCPCFEALIPAKLKAKK